MAGGVGRVHATSWWKKYQPLVGTRISRTVSPYRQDVLTHWLNGWPQKIKHKIEDNFFDVVPAFVFMVGTVSWANSTYAAESKKHRD